MKMINCFGLYSLCAMTIDEFSIHFQFDKYSKFSYPADIIIIQFLYFKMPYIETISIEMGGSLVKWC